MEEPSILDYLKARLTPWRGPAPKIPVVETQEQSEGLGVYERTKQPELAQDEIAEPKSLTTLHPGRRTVSWPWQAFLALCLALIAQLSLEPGPDRTWELGAFLYMLSFGFLVWGFWRSDWLVLSSQQVETQSVETDTSSFVTRPVTFLLALPVTLLAFLTLGGNLFTTLNVFLWLFAIFLVIRAFWVPSSADQSWWDRLRDFVAHPQWKLSISRWTLVFLTGMAVVIFFRVYRFGQVPPEMVSDHAEKLLDVWDVLHGQTRIFFPRNTGREAMQMYLTAAIIQVFGTDYTFISLKLGTVLAGVVTLPFMYLLGRDVGNRRVGLLAMIFAGIAYWPNVISRVGLRFPLYPLFVAPAMYYLIRGLRTGKLNNYILSGLALGIGLHGYTPIRILPFIIVLAIVLYMLHPQPAGNRQQAIKGFIVLALVALVVFLPLSRYALEDPEMFAFRSFTRLGSVERPLSGPAWQIFLENLWKAITMFVWDNGEIWVHSVTHRPALDFVSGALFSLGVVLLLVRYLRHRRWLDLFILVSVPILMMPSILSLAFPGENPSLNRAGGAIIPVFLIIAITLDALLAMFESRIGSKPGKTLTWGLALFLIVIAIYQNYDLVFNKYQASYSAASWNTTEMGQAVRDFTNFVGDPDSAYVVAYPHWVDTRLVGINAGYPLKDYAIWPEDIQDTLSNLQAKLFLVKMEDSESIEALRNFYPQGVLQKSVSDVPGHDFYIFFVPPDE